METHIWTWNLDSDDPCKNVTRYSKVDEACPWKTIKSKRDFIARPAD